MHPADYTFKLNVKYQYFFTSIVSETMPPYQHWLEKGVKFFSLHITCFARLYTIWKQMKLTLPFLLSHKKLPIINQMQNIFSTKNNRTTFWQITNSLLLSQWQINIHVITPKLLWDDHLIPTLSQEWFIFKSQFTLFYMHPTDFTFKRNDKNQDFSPLLHLK